ncbi:transcriptional regulator [Echinicola strongylocentroti]|uniref:Transcriptional regulator n=1 Tax=Echinicola strongylocentroti TaxID=1795355 RepID=A0A2Z4IFU0_9BACT|nr:response regulator [Echinicola strongylocentroti]AWW29358.1 transcriptional regulator [Echinicola strongylocentroti]
MKSSHKIALIYILIGGSWVTISSMLLDQIQSKLGIDNAVEVEVIKALLFVGASGLLIYFLVERSLRMDKKVWKGYAGVFDHMPISMWVVDRASLKIRESNLMARDVFDTNKDEKDLVGFDDFFSVETEEMLAFFGGRKKALKEYKLADKNGDERVMDIYAVPFIRNGRDKLMVAAVDNTSIHQNIMEKESLNQSLKEQNDRLRKFSFMNSHNLRRPLSNILGMMNFLSEERNSKEVIDMLKRSSEELDEEVKKMNEILAEEMVQNEFNMPVSGHRSKSILIVDDDKVQHLINKRLLLKSNPQLELYFFSNPLEALKWLENHKVDLLLLDINMPQMVGWDFLDQLIERKIKLEVKMLSSSIDPRDEERSQQYDMVSGFLVKPLKKDSLGEIL